MTSDSPSTASLPSQLDIWQETLAWQPTPAQQDQFQTLYAYILDANQHVNLTRITEPLDFWEKHLWDSLRGVAIGLASDAPARVMDVGTGAGFPGLPLAIARPDWDVTLLDSTRKKIDVVQAALPLLGLTNVTSMVGRVETLGHLPTHREQYDWVLLRAVASVATCAEYALPLVKLGGQVVLYRGQWTAEEEQQLQAVARQLGGAIAQVDAFETPITQGVRHSIYLTKVAATPAAYPRAVGIPKQQPLLA